MATGGKSEVAEAPETLGFWQYMDMNGKDNWRTGWDSNPRYGFPYAGFQDQSLKPLGHLSMPVPYAILRG